jgi:hypothetical protein
LASKSTLHQAHALVATILSIAGFYLFYSRDLNGPVMTPISQAETIGAVIVIIVALFWVHEYLGL